MRSATLRLIAVAVPLLFCAAAQAGDPPKPLYERLGGLKGITVVVDDFIDRLVTNKTLNKNPAINAGRKNSPAPYLKFQVAQLVCQVTGGPCKYTGLPMKDSHAHLNITEKEGGVMAGEFKKTLDKDKGAAGEQKELFDKGGPTKGGIVTKPERLANEQLNSGIE